MLIAFSLNEDWNWLLLNCFVGELKFLAVEVVVISNAVDTKLVRVPNGPSQTPNGAAYGNAFIAGTVKAPHCNRFRTTFVPATD